MIILSEYDANWHQKCTFFPLTLEEKTNNLDTKIRQEMDRNGYKKHLGRSSTSPFQQIILISEAYKYAITAENSINSTKELIMNEISNVHGLTSWVNPTLTSSVEK